MQEGWGGKHIRFFPPYTYYKMYFSGDRTEAKRGMKEWYFKRFMIDRLYAVPKEQGGMVGGSLFRLIAEMHRSNGIEIMTDLCNADIRIIEQGIERKVDDRFALLESIMEEGFVSEKGVISVQHSDDSYTLIDGHHRVAAMAACEYNFAVCYVGPLFLLRGLKVLERLKNYNRSN